jgi:hypothetical protein
MAFAGLGDNKRIGMNRLEYHDGFEASLRKNGPLAQKAGITSVITFSGQVFPDLNSEQGLRNTITGLKRLAPILASPRENFSSLDSARMSLGLKSAAGFRLAIPWAIA